MKNFIAAVLAVVVMLTYGLNPASAYEPGETGRTSWVCVSESAILELAVKNETKGFKEASNFYHTLLSKGDCIQFQVILEVTLEEHIYTYVAKDSGNLLSVWRLATHKDAPYNYFVILVNINSGA